MDINCRILSVPYLSVMSFINGCNSIACTTCLNFKYISSSFQFFNIYMVICNSL